MTDRRSPKQNIQPVDATDNRTVESDQRRPFAPPQVQELGKLEELTRQFSGTL